MQHRQNLVELQRHLRAQHPADIAVVLDSLSGDERQLVFGQLDPAQAGAALVESSDAVRASLIEELRRDELVRALGTLDADDLAFLSGEVPDDVMEEVSQALAAQVSIKNGFTSYMDGWHVNCMAIHVDWVLVVMMRSWDDLPGAAGGCAQIARDLVVEQSTVKTHLIHLYGKLGVRSRTRAVAHARSLGLLD